MFAEHSHLRVQNFKCDCPDAGVRTLPKKKSKSTMRAIEMVQDNRRKSDPPHFGSKQKRHSLIFPVVRFTSLQTTHEAANEAGSLLGGRGEHIISALFTEMKIAIDGLGQTSFATKLVNE